MRSKQRKTNTTIKYDNVHHISIPITKSMIDYLLQYKSPNGIDHVSSNLHNGYIELAGMASKKLLKIPFSIKLAPIKTDQKRIYFDILELKPVNLKWLNKMIFQKPPVLFFDEVVIIDLNGIERFKPIPVGEIRKVEVKENFIWFYVTLK